jgi:hypothetical protein
MSSLFKDVCSHFTHALFLLRRPRCVLLCFVYRVELVSLANSVIEVRAYGEGGGVKFVELGRKDLLNDLKVGRNSHDKSPAETREIHVGSQGSQ